jgi:hypothetical protein
VAAMIEWGSEDWGGNVHHASNGSWTVEGEESDE